MFGQQCRCMRRSNELYQALATRAFLVSRVNRFFGFGVFKLDLLII